MVLPAAIGIGADILLTLIQAYVIAAKQQGLTAEQAKTKFDEGVDAFMTASEQPVEAVK